MIEFTTSKREWCNACGERDATPHVEMHHRPEGSPCDSILVLCARCLEELAAKATDARVLT